jgi:hypothetical protein
MHVLGSRVLCWVWFQIEARYAGRDPVLGVMVTERPSCRRGFVPVWSADAAGNPSDCDRSAEHAHAVDAAARPQDRGFFETCNRPEVSTDLVVAAQLMGRSLGGSQLYSCLVFERRCSVLWLTNAVLLRWNESSVV